jgi:hypothetical protein
MMITVMIPTSGGITRRSERAYSTEEFAMADVFSKIGHDLDSMAHGTEAAVANTAALNHFMAVMHGYVHPGDEALSDGELARTVIGRYEKDHPK